jgi:uncharacterized protein
LGSGKKVFSALGIDLAGSPLRPTGICVMDERLEASCATVFGDEDVMRQSSSGPDIIAVDAPLSLPEGRADIDLRSDVHLRACDRELLKRKIKFFPITLGPMRMLTKRGMKLKDAFEKKGFDVAEVYPGAAQDILGISRQRFPEKLLAGLQKLGIKNLHGALTAHELDAATAAYVGIMHLTGNAEEIGNPGEGVMLLPV